jgi:eukaryotic-like serine/threonine-protein kinase
MADASAEKASPPSSRGAVIAKYQLRKRLGEGAMGVVYEAEDKALRRVVALKLLHPRVAEDPDRKRRFLREGRLAAHLNHPCIATVYEVGEADGRIFIAMELVKGEILAGIIERHPQGMPWIEALRIFREVARGLRKAHDAGIIHRDLKPDNVMVGEEGIVKILDFGVAKPTETFDIKFTDVKTHSGSLVGTPAYMSPEQAAGKPVDARSDVFSIGVVLYEMLTGHRPFVRDTWQELIIAINRDEATPVSVLRTDVPGEVDALVARCLAKKPDGRYPSCLEIVADADRLLAAAGAGSSGLLSTSESARPPGLSGLATAEPLSRSTSSLAAPPARGRMLLITLVLGAVAATAAIAVGVGDSPGPAPPTAAAPAAEPPTASAAASPSASAPEPVVTASASASATAAPPTGSVRREPPPPAPPPKRKNPVLGF